MSKGSLSSLKSQISTEKKAYYSAESKLSALEKQLLYDIPDKVGYSASESARSICNGFSANMDEGYRGADDMIYALETGYGAIDSQSAQAESIVAQARSIKRELGDI